VHVARVVYAIRTISSVAHMPLGIWVSAALTIYQFSSINVDWQISGVKRGTERRNFFWKRNYFSIL